MKAADLLKRKGSGVNTISSFREALKIIIENKVGLLVVIDHEFKPVGIITEREVIRLIYQKDESDWQGLAVSEVMTENIIIGVPDDDIEYIMALMTSNRFRHIPIISADKLTGLISIGDIVKSQLKDIKAENRYLTDYIAGKYPA